MKKFNTNDYVYIQITEAGWEHLKKTVGGDYINAYIKPRLKVINAEIWYKLQCHALFEHLPNTNGKTLFKPTIMIDDKNLKDAKTCKQQKQEIIKQIIEMEGIVSVEPIFSDPQPSDEILLNITFTPDK